MSIIVLVFITWFAIDLAAKYNYLLHNWVSPYYIIHSIDCIAEGAEESGAEEDESGRESRQGLPAHSAQV